MAAIRSNEDIISALAVHGLEPVSVRNDAVGVQVDVEMAAGLGRMSAIIMPEGGEWFLDAMMIPVHGPGGHSKFVFRRAEDAIGTVADFAASQRHLAS